MLLSDRFQDNLIGGPLCQDISVIVVYFVHFNVIMLYITSFFASIMC